MIFQQETQCIHIIFIQSSLQKQGRQGICRGQILSFYHRTPTGTSSQHIKHTFISIRVFIKYPSSIIQHPFLSVQHFYSLLFYNSSRFNLKIYQFSILLYHLFPSGKLFHISGTGILNHLFNFLGIRKKISGIITLHKKYPIIRSPVPIRNPILKFFCR